jgi:hypothetical protein
VTCPVGLATVELRKLTKSKITMRKIFMVVPIFRAILSVMIVCGCQRKS